MRLLTHLLNRFIRKGTLTVIDADGGSHEFVGIEDGPSVKIRIRDRALYRSLFFNPELSAGEAYMDETLTVEDGGTIHDFLYLFSINRTGLSGHASQKILRAVVGRLKRLQQANPIPRAQDNARHHYDVSKELYALFLDSGFQYSCAYFRDPQTDTLEQAQEAKLHHIAAKLKLRPGLTIAEIGSGWGGLAIHLAKLADVSITAVNVSPEQIKAARERAEAEGVGKRVRFEQMDYRQLQGRFDRVVSVGMFEHVGAPNFDSYFGKVKGLLKPDGFALIHAIGKMNPPGTTSPFIRKYIFPGGYSPAMSEVFASTERSGLWVADAEFLRLHYYHTIRHWRTRFANRRAEAAAIYDERFCRMWEFYLSAVELAFLHGSNMVFQLMLSKTRDAVPIVRDFIVDDERALMARNAVSDDKIVPLRSPNGG